MTGGGDARYSRPSLRQTQGIPGILRRPRRAELSARCPVDSLPFREGVTMKKLFAALLASVFALSSATALACSGDKAKDEKQMSSPSKPKI